MKIQLPASVIMFTRTFTKDRKDAKDPTTWSCTRAIAGGVETLATDGQWLARLAWGGPEHAQWLGTQLLCMQTKDARAALHSVPKVKADMALEVEVRTDIPYPDPDGLVNYLNQEASALSICLDLSRLVEALKLMRVLGGSKLNVNVLRTHGLLTLSPESKTIGSSAPVLMIGIAPLRR